MPPLGVNPNLVPTTKREGYRTWDVKEFTQTVTGEKVLPVGRVGAPGVRVRLHSPRTLRVVQFDLSRLGAMPEAPDPTPRPNEVLVSAVTIPETPRLDQTGPNGAPIGTFRLRGTYVFELVRPLEPGKHPTLPEASI